MGQWDITGPLRRLDTATPLYLLIVEFLDRALQSIHVHHQIALTIMALCLAVLSSPLCTGNLLHGPSSKGQLCWSAFKLLSLHWVRLPEHGVER